MSIMHEKVMHKESSMKKWSYVESQIPIYIISFSVTSNKLELVHEVYQ